MEKHKFLYILIGILSVLVLMAVGYIVYDNNVTNTDINENGNKEYKVLTEDSKMYLVEKKDNSYKVVYNFKEIINYIGIYKNKLYYSDTKIKYIDLNSNTLTEKVWLEIPQIECEENCTANEIDKSVIVGDTLYFNIGSFAAGTDKLDGLLSLSMNDSEFSEYKIISPLAEEWFVDEHGVMCAGAIAWSQMGKLVFGAADFQLLNKRNRLFKDREYFVTDRSYADLAAYFWYKQSRTGTALQRLRGYEKTSEG